MGLFRTKDDGKPKQVKTVCGGGKKQSEENLIKSKRNLFKLEKENKAIKDRLIRDIRKHFEQEEKKYYYKPMRVSKYT